MKILIHDYAGHPFQVQLSRELARRNHEVYHVYAGYNITPRGELEVKESDPSSFVTIPIFIKRPLRKYSFIKRWFQEREYGFLLSKKIREINPDIIVSANTPLDAQRIVKRKTRAPFIFWLQDSIGVAADRLLRKKFPALGYLLGKYYLYLEKRLLKDSDHIVVIADDFASLLNAWGISSDSITVIPNWAPIDSIPRQSKENQWAIEHKLEDEFCFMYTGTLGMKHNPKMLLDLAIHFQSEERTTVVVVSEGPGADWLRKRKDELNLNNLLLLNFQPFDLLPRVMGAADVLVALLDKEAGFFSVPSKVLTYLCAQRPLLIGVPSENLAARIVSENEAGFVVKPNDTNDFIEKAEQLKRSEKLRIRFAQNARNYANAKFDIHKIGDKFEEIFLGQVFLEK